MTFCYFDSSFQKCLEFYVKEIMELATACPAVVCCRCSPEQKAVIVRLIQQVKQQAVNTSGQGGAPPLWWLKSVPPLELKYTPPLWNRLGTSLLFKNDNLE